jgi:aldehyde dehydrogenase (NAD+)
MNQFTKIFHKQKTYFSTDVTKTYEWRVDQLNRLERLLRENEDALCNALHKDFKTVYYEQIFEVLALLGTIANVKSQLKGWMLPEAAELKPALTDSGHKGFIYREPYGVTLIIGPFNAPLILTFEPAIAALSAGNTCILKPSEATSNTTELLMALVPVYFEPEAVSIIKGDREAITEVLKLPFDFIFFTGSISVGKIIMKAAAENLTPVLLELGGQNATIVDETASLFAAAEKIAWGFTAMGGQWCVSPGYVYVHESVADAFVAACRIALIKMYGADAALSPNLSRIISEKDVDRIMNMTGTERIAYGGRFNKANRYIEPTIVYPAEWTDKIMEGEIFGPVLPILRYSNLKEIVSIIKTKPKGLAAYIFSRNQASIDYILKSISFGGGCINQANIHSWLETMPFGGVGTSGMGRYYGKHGFDSLSNSRNILFSDPDVNIDSIHPPYNAEKISFLKSLFAERQGD